MELQLILVHFRYLYDFSQGYLLKCILHGIVRNIEIHVKLLIFILIWNLWVSFCSGQKLWK